MFDVIFLSYDEPNADENFHHLLEVAPHAKRVNGIKGIVEAHKACAAKSLTSHFFVVDADSYVDPSFDFGFRPEKTKHQYAHVWRCQNAVNGLVYGYGGVKLFPRESVLKFDGPVVDFTTTVTGGVIVMTEIAGETRFNTSPFDAWKSGFREGTKLSSRVINNQQDLETMTRLRTWCSVGGDKPFGKYVIKGARAGREYGREYAADKVALARINDYDWLRCKFQELDIRPG